MAENLDVVTAGETMVLGVSARPGRLRHATGLELKIGGAESNLAIALSRLGLSAGWASYLGADEPGQLVLDRVRAEGVDTSRVVRVKDHPTGLYLREQVGTNVRVYYYRQGSAASTMQPEAFDPEYLSGVKFLHLTGITPALSEDCRAFVLWAVRGAGARVSFDVNYRSKLWGTEEARSFVEEILADVYLLFTGDEEARALWGRDDEALVRDLARKGPEEVVIKRGGAGSLALIEDEILEHPSFTVAEVDPVGAGDAFAAGYLAGHVWDLPAEERLRVANAMGALSVATLGDYEGLPDRDELEAFLEGEESLGR
ncbi:2-dehydro-3-deoxygluconokinase [uncultured Rubrobacteraceae bacterium]|uniref:2-dehydro-3-deoxygluconokinase n=1 Tax=uncultured Rubrobacteraceae bacterium TaxID=349277 RepID=A0A6J4QHZ8_9ACTN|nr:2-dehydro-3-deoxygluconokinase [uncultured Rubrobacteraceae bacterium]